MGNIKDFIKKLNENGVPLPMLRVDGKPSITATFAFIAFNTALLGQIGKISNFFGTVDLDSANYLFFGCLAAYLGRRWTNGNKEVKLKDKDEE